MNRLEFSPVTNWGLCDLAERWTSMAGVAMTFAARYADEDKPAIWVAADIATATQRARLANHLRDAWDARYEAERAQ